MDVKASNECEEIINSINKMTDTAIENIQIAQERAATAEQTLTKVKETVSKEINNAYQIGFREGMKYKNNNNDTSNEVSGGTQNTKENVAKLVLETKN
jgi:glutathionyl-hydroquinone reductase